MLAKEQYIGVAVLSAIAIGTWLFVVLCSPPRRIGISETESERAVRDSIRRAHRADSIARVKYLRDSLRTVRWEHMKDSFRAVDSLRFAAWSSARQARYDSFRVADSLWRDSVGLVYPRREKKDTILDLNRCDTTALQYIRGIGPYTARKIIEYREELGGYYSPNQLSDASLSRLGLDSLIAHFVAFPEDVRRIDVNSSTAEELARHPYLRFSQAKAIYSLRRKNVRLDRIEDLKQAVSIDSATYNRIQWYLRFD